MPAERDTRKGLSHLSVWLLSTLAEQGRHVFSVEEARACLSSGPESSYQTDGRLHDLLRKLVKSGWLQRLQKGLYLIVPLEGGPAGDWSTHPWLIVPHLVDPHMISHWSAANHHGFTEQVPRTIFVSTSAKVRTHRKRVAAMTFRFIVRPQQKLFGQKSIWIEGHRIFVSDPERTVIDCLDQPQHAGGIHEAIKIAVEAANGTFDWQRLSEYLERMDNGALYKRLGWLVEFFDLPCPAHVRSVWQRALTQGHSLLDPRGPSTGRLVSRWRIRVNIDLSSLERELKS